VSLFVMTVTEWPPPFAVRHADILTIKSIIEQWLHPRSYVVQNSAL